MSLQPASSLNSCCCINAVATLTMYLLVCRQLLEQRALVRALFSDISTNQFLSAALGVARTRHRDGGEEARKGCSVERTFGALSNPGLLQVRSG